MEKLVHFYKQVLDFAGMSVDENGFVHSFGVDRPVVTVEDKVMVIPTRTSSLRSCASWDSWDSRDTILR